MPTRYRHAGGGRFVPTSKFFDLSVLGDAQLAKSFEKLELKIARKLLKQELRKAFKPTLKVIKGLVPSELPKVRKGLKLRANRRIRRGAFGFRIFTPGRDELGIRPIKNPGSRGSKYRKSRQGGFYPMSWETGWTFINGRRMPARSYMRAGFRRETKPIQARLRKGLRARIEKEARALGKQGGLSKAAKVLS